MAMASAQERPRAGGQVEVAAFGPTQGRRLTATQHMADQVRHSLVKGWELTDTGAHRAPLLGTFHLLSSLLSSRGPRSPITDRGGRVEGKGMGLR